MLKKLNIHPGQINLFRITRSMQSQ